MWDDATGTSASSNREDPPDVDHALWPGLWEQLASRVSPSTCISQARHNRISLAFPAAVTERVAQVPHFEAVKAEGSWAGYYEYAAASSFDTIFQFKYSKCFA